MGVIEMAGHNLPGAGLTPTDAGDQSRQRQRLLAEFPLGLAPFTGRNLVTFGFWGGFLGAAIAGAVNLRRANRSRSIPVLILIALVLLFITQIVLTVIADRLLFSDTGIGQSLILFFGGVFYLVVSMIFAALIAGRQHTIFQRWLALAEIPGWRDQGGCLNAIGWLILGIFTSAILAYLASPVIGQVTIRLLAPPTVFMARGVTVTLPAGWIQIPPEKYNLDCSADGQTCLANAQDGVTGSTAFLEIEWTQGGVSLDSAASMAAAPIRTQHPSLPDLTPQPYTLPYLKGRSAFTFSANFPDKTYSFTNIADGEGEIDVHLNCANGLQAQCDSIRDQIVSTIQFASAS